MSYFAFNEINPSVFVKNLIGQSNSNYVENVGKEFEFIRRLLDGYYIIQPEDSQTKKYKSLSVLSSSEIDLNFLQEFENTLNLYARNKGQRTYTLKKVLKNKENKSSYRIFLEMETKFPDEPQDIFLMEINLSLENDSFTGQYKLLTWDERVLTRPPEALTSKKMLVDQNAYTELKLPCSFQYVGPVKNHENIEVNLESRNKLIKLKAKETLNDIAEYKASCKDRVFKFDIESDEKNQTIYHAFNMNDGKKKHRKLTEREKLIKILETHMDVEVQ